MSYFILIGMLFASQLSLAGAAQSIWEVNLDLELNNVPLTKAFEEIEEIDKLKDKLSQAHKCIADLKIKLAQCQLKK